MAQEARLFTQTEAPFSGKIAEVITFTDQKLNVAILDEMTGRPLPGQRLEVVQEDQVVGVVVPVRLEQAIRAEGDSTLAIHFKGTPGVVLERGQTLRVPQPRAEKPLVGASTAADGFIERLTAFTLASGRATLGALVVTTFLWVIYWAYQRGMVASLFPAWFDLMWLPVSIAAGTLTLVSALVWVTAREWLKHLQT